MSIHRTVLLDEVIEYLNIRPGAKIIDATLNGGGHTEALLQKFQDIHVLGIEWDPEIFKEAISNFQFPISEKRLIAVNDSYVNLKNISEEHDFQPDGIVFDLGVSSMHYERSRRGFTFMKDEPLDMRFNPTSTSQTAADIVNLSTQEELDRILSEYGEEKLSQSISKGIVHARKDRPIVTTGELVAVIENSVPGWYKHKKIHPATKTFQALRIAVNNELDNVEKGVLAAIDALNSGGRLVVISFHGLEDKIVREIFKQKTKEGIVRRVVGGTVKPTWEETRQNPRARSAKMKIVEKI